MWMLGRYSMQGWDVFTPPLDVMVGGPSHRSYSPTEPDVVKDDILYLGCLPDGDVELAGLDAGIRCLECAHVLDEEYVTDGSEALIYDDAEVAKGA